MIIDLDTDLLRELMQNASNASQQINEATNLLNATTVHNDWCCKERDIINEMTQKNKLEISKLQETSSLFYNAIKKVSDDFDTSENEISKMFETLESIIGKHLNVDSGNVNIIQPISSNDNNNKDINSMRLEGISSPLFTENSTNQINLINFDNFTIIKQSS